MKRTLFIVALAALVLAPGGAWAEDVVAYTNATVYTLSADGPQRLDDAVVITKGDRIEAVGSGLSIPGNATVVDAAGGVITPGLIDIETSLGLAEIWADSGSVDLGASRPIRPSLDVRDAYNPASAAIAVTRSEGVTSIIARPSGGIVAGQSVHCDLAGARVDKVCDAGASYLVTSFGRSAGGAAGGNRAEALMALRDAFADAAFLRDNLAAYEENRTRKLSLPKADLLALGPVLERKLPVYIHAARASDFDSALAWTKDAGVNAIFNDGGEAWERADELGSAAAFVVVHPTANLPGTLETISRRSDTAKLLHEAGARVIISTGDAHNVRNLRQLAGNAVRAGLPWDVALAAITATPADATGLSGEVGRIAPGLRANLVVWTGDPLELSSHAAHVVIDGVARARDSRQDALYERYKAPMAPVVRPAATTPEDPGAP